jgi:hypothetical protein
MLRSCSSRSRRSRSRAISGTIPRRVGRGRLPHDCLEVFEQVDTDTDRVVESLEFSSHVLDAGGRARDAWQASGNGTGPRLAQRRGARGGRSCARSSGQRVWYGSPMLVRPAPRPEPLMRRCGDAAQMVPLASSNVREVHPPLGVLALRRAWSNWRAARPAGVCCHRPLPRDRLSRLRRSRSRSARVAASSAVAAVADPPARERVQRWSDGPRSVAYRLRGCRGPRRTTSFSHLAKAP